MVEEEGCVGGTGGCARTEVHGDRGAVHHGGKEPPIEDIDCVTRDYFKEFDELV